ncbi:hypothetical protein MD484_g3348, partial [Candolleomyces efflorescens]
MLQHYREQSKSSFRNDARVEWSVPLPENVFRLIVEKYLKLDRPTLDNLSLTCKAFSSFCQQYTFQEVCIGPSAKGAKPRPTLIEIKKAIERSPSILDFIQVLRIRYEPAQGIILSSGLNKKSGPLTLNQDGKALQYILLRVKKLKVFELPELDGGQINLGGLRTLKYSGGQPSEQLSKVFSLSASTLESLELDVQPNGTNPDLDFSMLSRLKHIKFLKTFQNATTCNLETVELIIRTEANSTLENDSYLVDQVLQEVSGKFGSLRRLQALCYAEKDAWHLVPTPSSDATWIRGEQYVHGVPDVHHSNLDKVVVACVEVNASACVGSALL